MLSNTLSLIVLMSSAFSSNYGPDSYVPLSKLGKHYGFPKPEKSGDSITLKSKYSTLKFTNDSRRLTFNGTTIWMSAGTKNVKKKPSITNADYATVIDPLLRSKQILTKQKAKIVVIDAGHGGKNKGAIGKKSKYQEKKAVLDIAMKTKALLEKNGITVKLTRSSDKQISLNERVNIAKRLKADLFVSIHLNFASNPSANGLETFVTSIPGFPSTSASKPARETHTNNRHNAANMVLAYSVHKAIRASTGAVDRGIKHARFLVTREMPCPAILIEGGFLSNSKEESKLTTSFYRQKIASGLAAGIREYISKCQK